MKFRRVLVRVLGEVPEGRYVLPAVPGKKVKKFQAVVDSILFFSGKRPCSIMISWFLLVLAQVPGLVSLLFSSFFSGKGFCSIMISWFLLVLAKKFWGLSPYF